MDNSGERARMQVRRRRVSINKVQEELGGARAGSRDVVETQHQLCRGRASGEVLGAVIISGTEKSPEDMARSMLLGTQQGLAGEPCLVLMVPMNTAQAPLWGRPHRLLHDGPHPGGTPALPPISGQN